MKVASEVVIYFNLWSIHVWSLLGMGYLPRQVWCHYNVGVYLSAALLFTTEERGLVLYSELS